jgi:hypothetical protein
MTWRRSSFRQEMGIETQWMTRKQRRPNQMVLEKEPLNALVDG